MLHSIDFDTINTVLWWMLLVVTLYWAYLVFFCRGVPNITTAPVVRQKTVEIIREDMRKKGNPDGYTIVDLGSGYGFFVRHIAREIPQAHVIGVDCDMWAIRFCTWLNKRQKLGNVSYVKKNFVKYDLKRVDAVVFFLNAYCAHFTGKKLKEDLKEDALVVSNRFQLQGGWGEPDAQHFVKTRYPKQGKINVYHA